MKTTWTTLLTSLAIAAMCLGNCFAQNNIQQDSVLFAQYGKQKLYLDRYIGVADKAQSGRKPVLIWSFGGGWEGGNRKLKGINAFVNEFISNGYIVVAIDYRLGIKEAKSKGLFNDKNGTQMYLKAIDMAVEDLYAATNYLLNHADEWNIDPKQIVIGGGSSGATNSIVAEYGISNSSALAKKYLPEDFNYAGVVSMAGALWIPGENTKSVWKKKPCPFMFFIGNKDQLVTYNESHVAGFAGYGGAYLSKQFTEMGIANWFYDYVDGDHIIAAAPAINRTDEIGIFLKRFIAGKKELYLHTIEQSKFPTDFGHGNLLFDN